MVRADLIALAARQSATLGDIAHRPWPLPDGDWRLGQTWEDLLFVHWRVSGASLRAVVPHLLEIDRFDGEAWIGVTPFRITGLRVRGLPPLPFLSSFPELNVRTYVSAGGTPGIFFLSLDAARSVAVGGGRRAYKLPYYRARMSMSRAKQRVRFESERVQDGAERRAFRADYRPTGAAFEPPPGTLEHFLTERYRLYTAEGETLYYADIHHRPWSISIAEALIDENTMLPAAVMRTDETALTHAAEPQHTLIWPLRKADTTPQADAARSDSASRR
jgi:uncharacterized protein